jgi:hypothetical protein
MFSAIVLVCTMYVDKQHCFIIHNEVFYESYGDCNRKVLGLIDTGAFRYKLEDGRVYDAMEYTCYNWKAKKV